MKALQDLETSLNGVFTKNAPALPKGFKDFIVKILPWLSLVVGVLSLLAALSIYRWATSVNSLANTVNDYYRTIGVSGVDTARWSFWLYIALALLAVMAVLYILAFSPLQKNKKQGWDFLFYAFLINLVYSIVMLFTDYSSTGNVFGLIIGTLIGAYFLFQIRGYYTGEQKVASTSPPKVASTKPKE